MCDACVPAVGPRVQVQQQLRGQRVPLEQIDLPIGGKIPVGDASNGLCGGMTFATRDYYAKGLPVPEVEAAPGDGPLYDYVVRRLIDSFHIPDGVARFYDWMNRRDRDGGLPVLGLGPARGAVPDRRRRAAEGARRAR